MDDVKYFINLISVEIVSKKDNLVEVPDNILVRKSIEGNEDAFDELVKRYESKIYTLAGKLIKNKENVEEILQETFLKVYDSLFLFVDRETNFAIWLYRMAVNLCFEKLTEGGKTSSVIPIDTILKLEEENKELINWTDNPESILMDKELVSFMKQVIHELPPDLKVVFVLRDMEGFSNKEVSEILNRPVDTIKSEIHTARAYLQQKINSYFGTIKNNYCFVI